jgi:tetratricopeptide (TPR) repeat protein
MIVSTPRLWLAYALLLCATSAFFFAPISELGLDTHDAETFRDHARIDADFSFFFSPEKEQLTGRPFAELCKYAISLLIGNESAPFHWTVIALHTACSLLLAFLAVHIGTALPVALIGGLLFLVNISHFQAVHLIAAFDYPLALFLSLVALLAYTYYLSKQHMLWLASFYLLAVLATLSHLSATAIWPFALYLCWQRRASLQDALKHLAPLALLLALSLAANLALASRQTSTWDSLERYPQSNPLLLLLDWGQMLLWLSSRLLSTAHYMPIKVYQLQTWELFFGALCVGPLIFLVYRRQVWSAWTLLSLLPFITLTSQTLLDMPVGPSRYLYPASAGASLLLAQALWQIKRPWAAVLLFVLLASSLNSRPQTEALSRYTSGRSYLANADLPKGIEQLRRAAALAPHSIHLEDVYTRLAVVIIDSISIAEPTLNEALHAFPEHPKFTIAHEVFLALNGEQEERAAAKKRIAYLGRQSADNAIWIAKLCENAGRGFANRHASLQAITAYEQALIAAPKNERTRNELGWLLFAQNRFEEAIYHYQLSLSDAPNPQAHFYLALAYLALGDLPSARQTYADALAQYGSTNAEYSSARAHLERFITLGIQTQEVKSLIERHFGD